MKKIDTVKRSALLEAFGLVTEEELALILDVDVRTLRNRAKSNLPPFTKSGGKRLFFKEDVLKHLRERMVMDEDGG